jgi:glycosyltransferase involved in cell wall biosynthesis
MKIGIDARLYGTKHRGLGRYTQKLIEYLERLDSNNEYYVFLQRDNFDDYTPGNPHFTKVLADYRPYSLKEQLSFPFVLYAHNFDLVHFPHFSAPLVYFKRSIVTIHDLLISHYPSSRATTLPSWLYVIKVFIYKFTIKLVARNAAQIITVSEYTKSDIVKLLKIPVTKITVTYEGVDVVTTSPQKIDATTAPYLLYVGAAYPHKNLERLIEAFGIYAQENPAMQLILVGKHDFFYQRLIENTTNKRIIFPGYVSDTELASLYQGATAYIFPSLLEGFGLPALEAQAHRVAVVSSNTGSLPEILGDSALYFNPENIQEMVSAIRSICRNGDLREQLQKRGEVNIKRFSWQEMAKTTHHIYTHPRQK